MVITREPLTEYLPIQRKPEPGTPIEDAPMVTQYEMHGVEDLGLLKMDFLGLRNLDVMEIALDLIERVDRRRGPTSTTSRSTTPKTFDAVAAGRHDGRVPARRRADARAAALADPDARSKTSRP